MTYLLLLPALLYFGRHRLNCYLQYLQQDAYETRRFLDWWWNKRAFDRKATLTLLALPTYVGALLMPAFAWKEGDPSRDGKLPLKLTERAKRILLWSMVCSALLAIPAALSWISAILWIQSLPFQLALVNELLWPAERRLQARYASEARARIAHIKPTVIGITGSYGKTSTKEALGQILQVTRGNTFWPHKGVNTLMGITRSVREDLLPGMKYAVIEMGAHRLGSIANACSLTPPDAAIITTIGMAHLERFKTREIIYQAKSELARAVPESGILVCNGDDEGTRRIAKEFPKRTTLLYGFSPDCDCRATDVHITPSGTTFTLHWNRRSYPGHTPSLGRPALSNLLGAFAMACALGADPEFVLATLAHLPPVDNRLKLQGQFLHDAYNSNPIGFEAALDVLQALPAKRRILVTPGIIELGQEQYATNHTLAQRAAKMCDVLIQVGATNRAAWTTNLRDIHIESYDNRDQALAALRRMQQEGDLILIENDLPDIYETQRTF